MKTAKLQDRLHFALGRSARHTGEMAEAFRPSGAYQPLNRQNRYLRLPATFLSASGNAAKLGSVGNPVWQGVFDAAYTRPGDYIMTRDRTFFIGAQPPLLPISCVLTNRVISITRPANQSAIAANAYGGYTPSDAKQLMLDWPASVLADGRLATASTGLPTERTVPYLNVWVPAYTGVSLAPGDIIVDDLERMAVIASSELTAMGWRLSAKMALS